MKQILIQMGDGMGAAPCAPGRARPPSPEESLRPRYARCKNVPRQFGYCQPSRVLQSFFYTLLDGYRRCAHDFNPSANNRARCMVRIRLPFLRRPPSICIRQLMSQPTTRGPRRGFEGLNPVSQHLAADLRHFDGEYTASQNRSRLKRSLETEFPTPVPRRGARAAGGRRCIPRRVWQEGW